MLPSETRTISPDSRPDRTAEERNILSGELRSFCNLGSVTDWDSHLVEFYDTAILRISDIVDFDIQGTTYEDRYVAGSRPILELARTPSASVVLGVYDDDDMLTTLTLNQDGTANGDWKFDPTANRVIFFTETCLELSDNFLYPLYVRYAVGSMLADQRIATAINYFVLLDYANVADREIQAGPIRGKIRELLSPLTFAGVV